MRSTSSLGAWTLMATLMLSSGLQAVGAVLSLGLVVLLAGTVDSWMLGAGTGLVGVAMAALEATLLLWVVLRVSPEEPSLPITVAAVVVGLVGWGASYGASTGTSFWLGRAAGAVDVGAYYAVVSPMWLVGAGIRHTSWIAALIVAHVKGLAAAPGGS